MSTQGFLCPYCLAVDAEPVLMGQSRRHYYACRECETRIPQEYIDSGDTPREVMPVVGLRGHGKSVYLAVLYHELNELARLWTGFYAFAMDAPSLDAVKDNLARLKAGELPGATPASFPTPTIIRLSNIPFWGERVFLFYDTGGEAFGTAESMVRDAGFFHRAQTVCLLLSLDDFDCDPMKMYDLLSIYVQGASELGADTRRQNLVVVLSKGDRLKPRLGRYPEVWDYLVTGTLDRCLELSSYLDRMEKISYSIADFIAGLGAIQFLNLARDRFRSTEFCLVSALGAQPGNGRLQVQISPKRVIDPLLWALQKSGRYGEECVPEESKHEWFQILYRRRKKGAGRGDKPA